MNLNKNLSVIATAEEKTMTSREIAALTGSKHDSVLKTIRALVERGVVFGNETPYTHPQNGQTYTEFSLDYRNTMVVVSGYSAELRAKIIDRWQELEAKQAPVELTRMDLIRLAMEAEQERLLLAAQVEEMQPAVAALERLTESDGTFNVREAAKQLNLKPSQLTTWMSANNWIYKQGAKSNWMAYQPRINAGLMMHKTTAVEGADGITTIRSQARITAKGLTTISKTIEKANRTAKMLAA